jgi:hypothetical protein
MKVSKGEEKYDDGAVYQWLQKLVLAKVAQGKVANKSLVK